MEFILLLRFNNWFLLHFLKGKLETQLFISFNSIQWHCSTHTLVAPFSIVSICYQLFLTLFGLPVSAFVELKCGTMLGAYTVAVGDVKGTEFDQAGLISIETVIGWII